MAKLGDPTDFSYRVAKVIKIIDGDTIDRRNRKRIWTYVKKILDKQVKVC